MVTLISIRPLLASIRNIAAAAALMCLLAGYAHAQDFPEPGTCESAASDPVLCHGAGLSIGKASATMSLSPYATFTGNIAVSVDGAGTNQSTANIRVEKPSDDATVRAAYLMVASTGFGRYLTSSITLNRGDSWLLITPSDYDQIVGSAINSENGILEITDYIASHIDPEPAGIYDFQVAEAKTHDIDGEVLVVVFDEPSAPTSTYVLTFGAQDINGDSFSVTLSEPFDDAAVDITMSLGISFSFQGRDQYSIIEVNGQRLTTSAGGQDDGSSTDGTLITVGGIGDDPANPADPFAKPTHPRSDDELYTIDPFLEPGDTEISIFSSNPSNNDNIFFAGFLIRGSAAVIGEGILLTPPSTSRPVGMNHSKTAFLQDDNGDPVVGRQVNFEVTSGPNAGMTHSSNTDAAGKATFAWSSALPGKDIVKASFLASTGTRLSTTAEVNWEPVQSVQCDLPRITGEVIDAKARTITLTFEDADGIAGISYRYPADFPDADKAGEPALINLTVIDDGGLSTTNGIDFTATAPNPTVVTQVLEVVGDGRVRVTYFPLITDACQDPGPQVYDADPIREFAAGEELPAAVTLEGNFPNPFNPTTMIRFALPEAMDVSVRVFDVLGREVATLLNESTLSAGPHELRFDAMDLPSGIYLFSVQADDQVQMGRMILAK